MCGIVGILRMGATAPPLEPGRLTRMRDALRHRGPDGEGLYIKGPIALGHRRLAIVDVEGGQQPMCNEDGTVWITFNGEIYNHASLRSGLEARGHRYKTRSDTETILHLYEEEGERCVQHLSGMFAFAIWDENRGRLLLARDRLGIKPLYYTMDDQELLFGSEIKAILAAGHPARLNHAVLPEYLATRFVSGSSTMFQGVKRLEPGRTLTWTRDEGLRERRYWSIPPVAEDDGRSAASRAADLRHRLRAAVESHLMSDVPLGLFLSGGIDSSGLLGLMAPLVREPVRTFAVGFAEREADELAYARLAARSAGALHREMVLSPDQFFDALPRLIWHEDEPIAFSASVPLYFLSRLAAENVKVVLTGEGADELFLGYNRYRVTAWNERLSRTWSSLLSASARRSVRDAVQRLPRPARRYAERSFLGLDPGPRSLFCENFSVFGASARGRVMNPDLMGGASDPHQEEMRCYEEAQGSPLDRMSRADLQTYLPRLLMKQDTMSMAASIESRVPFLDHELVEHVAALPAAAKLRGFTTKAVLRDALRNVVPKEILNRPKMGFPVPLGRWLRGAHWPVVREFVLSPRASSRELFEPGEIARMAEEHRTGAVDHGERLWLLINLEIWHRVFLERESTSSVMEAA
jgi:asparagine synthase (glutamine-hydrolysing)